MTAIANIEEIRLQEVVAKGRELWADLRQHPDFHTLVAECGKYNPDWAAARGAMALPGVNLTVDGKEYVIEGLRLMVLNVACGGMIPAPSSVDAAMHAATAQLDLIRNLAESIGLVAQHRTLEEATMQPYTRGGFTDLLYTEVFGHEPPSRFWLDQSQIDDNFRLIAAHLRTVGIDLEAAAVAPDAFDRLRALQAA